MKKWIYLIFTAVLMFSLTAVLIKVQPPQGKYIFSKPFYENDAFAVYEQKGQYLIVNKSRVNEQLSVPAGGSAIPAEVTPIKNKPAGELPLHGVTISCGVKITSGRNVYIAGAVPELTLLASYPAPETAGDWIIVDKNTNILYFYMDGELYKSYRVATGKEPHLTPEGSFTIMNKLGDEDLNEALGIRWMGLGVPFENDNRSKTDHRAPEGLKYGIHGTDKPDSIGSHASGGCIRMSNQDIIELHRLAKVGTRVDIVEDIHGKT
ncbi:MAG: L,D-transpeptidase [Dehalobacter sp.]|nr:L,D-transpeptidase [Dehalobacter sp.]